MVKFHYGSGRVKFVFPSTLFFQVLPQMIFSSQFIFFFFMVVQVQLSPFLILYICVLCFFLYESVKGLLILFIFSKSQLLDLLILRIVLLVSMLFNSALILVISFLILSLGFILCCSSSSYRYRVSCLFEMFISFLGRPVLL